MTLKELLLKNIDEMTGYNEKLEYLNGMYLAAC